MAVQRITGRSLQSRRLKVWSEHPHCAMCGELVAYPAGFELDHKISLYAQGADTEDNVQILCIDVGDKIGCHRKKTANDLGFKAPQQARVRFDGNGRIVW